MDWQLTCRVCLETGDMVSLFDWDENNEQLSDKYTFCCGVEVTKEDSLPTLICLNCVDRLTFAYQFKQQCISSTDTLKECLEEFIKSSNAASDSISTNKVGTEVVTIKQENGMYLKYELPVEHAPYPTWQHSKTDIVKLNKADIRTSAPAPKKRGRPRKYPDEHGNIELSPYQRKKPKKLKGESLDNLLSSSELKQEPEEEEPFEDFAEGDDPDFVPADEGVESDVEKVEATKKRGRPRKYKSKENDEDVLLQETILAISEPIPKQLLNPKPKEKKKKPKNRPRPAYMEKTHTCETCGSSFTSNASLQAHIRRHLGIKPFVCSVCGYSSVMKEALKRHMMKHTGEKPYQCRICERRFADYGTRQKHERLHIGLRPYKCTLCPKSFTYSYVLSNHMLTHTGEKKYSCGPCNKKFTKAHHLKYHNKVHHKELYIQQQLEQEAKRMRQQINVTGLSGVITGQLAGGSIQLVPAGSEDGEQDTPQMQVVEEECVSNDEHETDRAVANMQGVVLDVEFGMDEDEEPKEE